MTGQHSPWAHPFASPPPRGLRAVVFDLGGTLIDYRGGSDRWPAMERPGIESLHTCLTAAGYLLDADLFHDAFVRAMDARWQAATAGMGDPPTLHSLILEVCSAAGHNLADDVHQAAVAAYHQPIAAQAVTRHGATDVLGWLQAHGVRLGLISNSVWPGDAHRLDLERHGLAQFLDFTVFSSECGLWKPNPAIFWHVLERLGVDPMHAAFVGDRFAEDIGGAQAAGLHPVYIEGTTDYEHIDPAAYHPEARITSLAELPAALRRIFS